MSKNQHNQVKAKKSLGQHFLRDRGIALDIVELLSGHQGYQHVLEVGPGMGVLTKDLVLRHPSFKAVELDRESVDYLLKEQILRPDQLISADFLHLKTTDLFTESFGLIGNLPYNISSQIFFKTFYNKDQIPEVVAMVQREVADRIVSRPGKKANGILSILLQAWYDIEIAIHVPPEAFSPPPKVQSAVLRMKRNQRTDLGCSEKVFVRTVKQAFSMRRKTLKNALKPIVTPEIILPERFETRRAEELGVEEFIELTLLFEQKT